MSEFTENRYVHQVTSGAEFDQVYKPGEAAPISGIYRCRFCGREMVIDAGRTFPPDNDPRDLHDGMPVKWKLLVKPTHRRNDSR